MIDKSSLGKHISHQFNEEIEDLRERVLSMGGIVEQVLDEAIQALASGRAQSFSEVKAEDRKVNSLEVFIDEAIAELIARRQPTASDLRLVLSVSRVIVDLERIGDESKKVYRMATRLTDARGKVENLSGRVSDLDRQLVVQTKEAEMLSARVTDLENRLAIQGKILAEREYENNLLRQQAEAAKQTEQKLREDLASGAGNSAAVEKLRAEKAALEDQLTATRDERSKLQRDINLIKQQAESSWSTERPRLSDL